METRPYARWFAKRGMSIFPCHTIEEGRCTCHTTCPSPGKHPNGSLVPHGVLEATTDLQTVDQWWALFPDANIGLATGAVSGVTVIDIDPDKGGEDAWSNLENVFETVENTWWVETGSGGFHVYFEALEGVRNSASVIGPGIDVRGDGGYVIAPPSLHVSGERYRWSDHLNHETIVAPAPLPDWLQRRIMGKRGTTLATAPLPERITEGARNVWMASLAGTMRRRGMSRPAVEAALQIENRLKCAPPLDEREVERIAGSIDRYPASVSNLSVNGLRASA